MTMTDPIADMLTRIRNANRAHKDKVEIPASKLKKDIARILDREGYIKKSEVVRNENFDYIVIHLKYGPSHQAIISGIKRISTPGLRVYAKKDKMPRVLGGLGIDPVNLQWCHDRKGGCGTGCWGGSTVLRLVGRCWRDSGCRG